MYGETSQATVSNLFLLAQAQIKNGNYSQALSNSEKIIAASSGLRESFGDDFAVVVSKFYAQAASVAFVTNKFESALSHAEKGLKLMDEVDLEKEDAAVKKNMRLAKRDLLNLLVRTQARLTGRSSTDLRHELAKKHDLGSTFMSEHDDQQASLAELTANIRT